ETVAELTRFDEPVAVVAAAGRADDGSPEFAALDRRFEELRERAVVVTALDHQQEDLMMSMLLRAGIQAWIAERGAAAHEYEQDPSPSSNPALHAGLRHIIDEPTDAQTRCAFRAIAHPHYRAVQVRLKKAIQQSGIDEGDAVRRLFILRRDDWPSGQKTKELVDDFTRRGGVQLDVDLDDLRTFDALSKLLRDNGPVLKPWLVARQPASSTKLLRKALSAEVPNGLSADAVAGVEPSVDTPSDAGPDGSTSSDVGHHGRTPSDGGHSGSLTSGAGPPAERQPDGPSISLGAVAVDRLWLTLASRRT